MERREGDNDMSAIAMPGFIDILSTVIIMFVFFVTVIAIMLYVHMVKFKSALQAESQVHISEEIKDIVEKIKSGEIDITKLEEIETLEAQKKEMEQEIEELSAEVKQVKAEYSSSEGLQRTIENDQEKSIVVFFDKNAISIGEETEAVVQAFLTKYGASGAKIKIESPINPKAPTTLNAKQISLARMLNARNILLKAKLPQNNVDVSYSAAEAIDGDYNWVKVIIQ